MQEEGANVLDWSQYEPQFVGIKKLKVKEVTEEEEQECMICLDKPASTLVLPCEHRVVCDDCSRGLRNTPDNTICVRCRRRITHVAYAGENSVEEK